MFGCQQESLVTPIKVSSHCVLNQLCFSTLSRTFSSSDDICVRVVCASVCVCVRECVRLFVMVHGSVCRVSMITQGGKGQRQLTRRGEERGSGTDQMRREERQEEPIQWRGREGQSAILLQWTCGWIDRLIER